MEEKVRDVNGLGSDPKKAGTNEKAAVLITSSV